jgi:hypothetical protein
LNGLAILALGASLVTSDIGSTPSFQMSTALLSIGYAEAKLSDFVDTAGYERRRGDPAGFLAVSADFRGDGHIDQARVLRNPERGVAYIVVVTVREKIDTYVVKAVSLADADNIGIRVANPAQPGGMAVGLTIFALDGSATETFDLVDDDFEERPSPPRP